MLQIRFTGYMLHENSDLLTKFRKEDIRNKFHFSEVHRSMDATGHVQSK